MPSYQTIRHHLDRLIDAALQAADPAAAVSRFLTRDSSNPNGPLLLEGQEIFRPGEQGRLILISTGKAALSMAQAAVAIAGDIIDDGIVVGKIGQVGQIEHPRIKTIFAAHPVANQSSLAAADELFKRVAGLSAEDVVLYLISGGTSALISKPLVSLPTWQKINDALLASGRPIQDINTVRQQLDRIKGGGLLAAAAPAAVYTLILSDVIGNPLDKIGSGPTVPPSGTATDAANILRQIGISVPPVLEKLEGAGPSLGHTATLPVIIGDIRAAGEAAVREAAALGFEAEMLTWFLEGEAREIGRFAAALGRAAAAGRCLILGGESTVTIRGNGIGGRNLETALAAAIHLEGMEGCVVASLATDGDDGPTGAAGAVVTGQSALIAAKQGGNAAHFLANNDSLTFFKTYLPTNLIITGQTGTNVNDLIFILKY